MNRKTDPCGAAAIARKMHGRGYQLAIMSPSDSCEKLADELGGVAHRDVAENAADTQANFDLAMKTYGRVDACLINLGGPPKGVCWKLRTKTGMSVMKAC